jgi:hypothetical protein
MAHESSHMGRGQAHRSGFGAIQYGSYEFFCSSLVVVRIERGYHGRGGVGHILRDLG